MRWPWRRRHECWPPGGVVFERTWRCPDCGTRWALIEHANSTEWVRDDT